MYFNIVFLPLQAILINFINQLKLGMKKQLFKCMRKHLRVLAFLWLLGGAYSFAQEPIDLSIGIDEIEPNVPGHGKSPILIPSIWQNEYQILFDLGHADYTLCLVQNDVVMYSIYVSPTTTMVNLPLYLFGMFEIRLYGSSNYYYYGYIEL